VNYILRKHGQRQSELVVSLGVYRPSVVSDH